ncbi:arginase family protein [Luteibacter anthropi]|uniref:arginase family protein n=1 Tax=Luteibacter anthropi TaxID=564369 RepID=UPI002032339A|nr:arginase family protein [Luteibacter anthropi]URX63498.1 arginase family protein [Luteibacter anthropi]
MTLLCAQPTTLFGWPRAPRHVQEAAIAVIGVPSDYGNAYVSGGRHGPASIRAASMGLDVAAAGFDHGNIIVSDGVDWPGIVERTQEAVLACHVAGNIPLLLGGDHAVSYGAIAAIASRTPIDIVWFDAHTDFCPWSEVLPHNHKQVLRRIASLPGVGRMLVAGHRGMTYFDESTQDPRLDVMRMDEGPIALPHAWSCPGAPVYVSVDIDALDPTIAPGTGHPVPGGLTVLEVLGRIEDIAARRQIVGFDLTEVNPLLDHDGMTARAAATILAYVAGLVASQLQAGGYPLHSCQGATA